MNTNITEGPGTLPVVPAAADADAAFDSHPPKSHAGRATSVLSSSTQDHLNTPAMSIR